MRCPTCSRDVLDAETVTARLQSIINNASKYADEAGKRDAEAGFSPTNKHVYIAGSMQGAINGFIESLRFMCQCKAEKPMKRPKSKAKTTWGTCKKLHVTDYAEGTDPGNCAKCGQPVRGGGAA